MDLSGPALRFPYRQTVSNNLLGQGLLGWPIVESQQRSTVPRGEMALNHEALYRRDQVQKPHGVGHRGARSADSSGDVLLGQTKVVHQLAVAGRLFKGIQILAVHILDDSSLQRSFVVRIAHECRDIAQAGSLGRSPPALPRNNFIAFQGFSHNDGLHDAYLGY